MYAQLSLLISLHLFILPTEYHALLDHEIFYLNCSKAFNCGENVRGIGYPFWGGDRPKYCGLEGLKLSCENSEEDFVMLDIGSDTKFCVQYIDVSSHEIEMKRYDILPNETCPPKILTSAKFNETLFGYSQGSVDLHLFYNSTPPRLNISIPTNFTCVGQGIDDENVVFFGNESLLVQFPFLQYCKVKVKVPVNRKVLEECGKNEKMELQDLLSPSFVVNYRFNNAACLACMKSGGVCWSGIDSSSVGLTCLCRDGAYPYSCPPKPSQVVVKSMFFFLVVSTFFNILGIILQVS